MTKQRVDWVDYAKGICIFFVVMLHVNDVVQDELGIRSWLDHVVTFARPFRMPDFFLIAGLFLAASMRRPWRSYLDTKVVHFLYFYALWMTLNFALFDLRHATDAGDTALLYLGRYLDPKGPLWFIHILPVFFVVTRLTRGVPAWILWPAAAILHSLPIDTGWHVPDQFAQRYVFFYTGYAAARHVFAIADWARAHRAIAAGYLGAWGVGNGLLVAAGVASAPVASLALGYAGALAVIVTAVLLANLAWTAPLRFIGENSIVLYLGEALVSALAVRALARVMPDGGSLALVGTLVTIAGTVLLWRAVMRTPARFLYRRPAWLHLRSPARSSGGAPVPTSSGDPAISLRAGTAP